MVENRSVDIKQNTNDRDKVIKEFNRLFADFREKSSNAQDLEHFETLGTEKISFDNKVIKSSICTGKLQGQNMHNQFDQRVTTISQLKGPEKEEFIEKALDFACNIQYGDLRAQALSLLVPILEGKKRLNL